jgi:hypothetical protein
MCAFLWCKPANAQDSQEFWPEIDAYMSLTPASRLYFVAAVGKEEDIPTLQGDFGANIDFFSSRFFVLVCGSSTLRKTGYSFSARGTATSTL